jgi:hypothetical protein
MRICDGGVVVGEMRTPACRALLTISLILVTEPIFTSEAKRCSSCSGGTRALTAR